MWFRLFTIRSRWSRWGGTTGRTPALPRRAVASLSTSCLFALASNRILFEAMMVPSPNVAALRCASRWPRPCSARSRRAPKVEGPGSLKPMWPFMPMPKTHRSMEADRPSRRMLRSPPRRAPRRSEEVPRPTSLFSSFCTRRRQGTRPVGRRGSTTPLPGVPPPAAEAPVHPQRRVAVGG